MKRKKILKIINEELNLHLTEEDLNQYKGIEKGLDSKLIDLINEYRDLSEEEKEKQPLLWWLLKKSTAYYKFRKEVADYIDKSQNPDTICGNCTRLYEHITSRTYICDWVGFDDKGNDNIAFDGWCKYWTNK